MPGTPSNAALGIKATSVQAKTDMWLTELLCKSESIGDALGLMCHETSSELRRLSLHNQRHAYVGVGWCAWRVEPDILRPAIFVVSNYLDGAGRPLAQFTPDFRSGMYILPSRQDFYWMPAGQSLSREQGLELNRRLRRAIAKKQSPRAIAALLADTIIAVSKNNPTVGESLMITILPRVAVPVPSLMQSGALDDDAAYFAYIPSANSKQDVQFFPNFAAEGMAFAGVAVNRIPSILMQARITPATTRG
jgi:hypothetical protein